MMRFIYAMVGAVLGFIVSSTAAGFVYALLNRHEGGSGPGDGIGILLLTIIFAPLGVFCGVTTAIWEAWPRRDATILKRAPGVSSVLRPALWIGVPLAASWCLFAGCGAIH